MAIYFTNPKSHPAKNKGLKKGKNSNIRLKKLLAFFPFEAKRIYCKKNIFIWISILLLMIIFINKGINDHLKLDEKNQKLKKIQTAYFNLATSYEGYGRDGIRFYFTPSNNRIFRRNTIIPSDLWGNVDSIVKVNISMNMKGKSLITNLFFGPFDFCLVILLLLTPFAQYCGYDSIQSKEYLKFLISTGSFSQAIISVFVTRFLLFAGGIIALFACAWGFCLIRGIVFTTHDITGFNAILGYTLILMLIFFAIGFLISTFRKPGAQLLTFNLAWILLAIIAVFLFVSINENKFQNAIIGYNNELAKIDEVVAFEKRAVGDNIRYTPKKLDRARKRVEKGYLGVVLKKTSDMEAKLFDKIQAGIESVNLNSIFIPTVFFLHTCSEASSCGYSNFLLFYKYTAQQQENFARFWIDRVYRHDPKKMVPFITGDKFFFQAQSRVPENFWISLILSFFYGFVLFYIAFTRFKRIIQSKQARIDDFSEINLEIDSQKKTVIRSAYPVFNREFLNVFFGCGQIRDWQIAIDGQNLVNKEPKDILYLPSPVHFPGDVSPRDFTGLIKRLLVVGDENILRWSKDQDNKLLKRKFHTFDREQQSALLLRLSQFSQKKIIIFNDFIQEIPKDKRRELSDLADEMTDNGITIIDLSSSDTLWLDHDQLFTVNRKEDNFILS